MGCGGSEEQEGEKVTVAGEGTAAGNFGIIDADGGGTLDFEEMAAFGINIETHMPYSQLESCPPPSRSSMLTNFTPD